MKQGQHIALHCLDLNNIQNTFAKPGAVLHSLSLFINKDRPPIFQLPIQCRKAKTLGYKATCHKLDYIARIKIGLEFYKII